MTDAASEAVAAELAAPTKPSSLRRFEVLKCAVPDRADIVLIGDSLAATWPAEALGTALGRRVWNFGLPGDRIRNTRWRLRQVVLGHLRPERAIVVLGTNDLGDGVPASLVSAGFAALVAELRALWPPVGLVLVGVPWRRTPIAAAGERDALNSDIARQADGPRDLFVDPDTVLGEGEAETAASLAEDGLHLTAAAYERLTAHLGTRLSEPAQRCS